MLLSKVGLSKFKCPISSHIRDGQLDIMIIMIYRWSHDVVPPVSWPFKLGLPRGFQFRSQFRAGMTRVHPAKALAAELDIWAAVCREVRARC